MSFRSFVEKHPFAFSMLFFLCGTSTISFVLGFIDGVWGGESNSMMGASLSVIMMLLVMIFVYVLNIKNKLEEAEK